MSMGTKKRWTAEEDKILIEAIKNNFDNLAKGFNEAATTLNRTPNAVSSRWYAHLSNPESKAYIGSSCFIGFGEKKRYSNRKNYREGFNKQPPQKQSESCWKKLLRILGIN